GCPTCTQNETYRRKLKENVPSLTLAWANRPTLGAPSFPYIVPFLARRPMECQWEFLLTSRLTRTTLHFLLPSESLSTTRHRVTECRRDRLQVDRLRARLYLLPR